MLVQMVYHNDITLKGAEGLSIWSLLQNGEWAVSDFLLPFEDDVSFITCEQINLSTGRHILLLDSEHTLRYSNSTLMPYISPLLRFSSLCALLVTTLTYTMYVLVCGMQARLFKLLHLLA